MPEPELSSALMPTACPEGNAALTLLGMVRPRVQPLAALRADHNWNTWVWAIKLFMLAVATTAAVQLEKPLQNPELVPPSADSKKGWGAGLPPAETAK